MEAQLTRTLADLPAGEDAVVVALAGGREFTRRMISMGLCPGCSVRVLRTARGRGGPVVVAVGATRLAIGHGMADKVEIAPYQP